MAVSLLQAHSAVPDPHGDRAYADARFVPLEGDVINQSRTADKPEDESRQTITLADDTSLSIPVTGSARYAVDAFLIVDGDPDAGMSLTFTAPAGSSGSWTPLAPQTTGGIGDVQVTSFAFDDPASVGVTAQGVIIPPKGALITGGSPGVFTLQWAQANTGVSPLFLRAGSWLRLTRTG